MAPMMTIMRRTALAAVLGGAVALSGCGAGGVGVEVDAPILNAVGINLSGKQKDDEDLPERTGLVVPPTTESLPTPGERTAAAAQAWPDDPDLRKKREEEEKAAAEDKYCREGNWDPKANISEFNKNIGVEQRCASQLGKALSKSLGGGSAE